MYILNKNSLKLLNLNQHYKLFLEKIIECISVKIIIEDKLITIHIELIVGSRFLCSLKEIFYSWLLLLKLK